MHTSITLWYTCTCACNSIEMLHNMYSLRSLHPILRVGDAMLYVSPYSREGEGGGGGFLDITPLWVSSVNRPGTATNSSVSWCLEILTDKVLHCEGSHHTHTHTYACMYSICMCSCLQSPRNQNCLFYWYIVNYGVCVEVAIWWRGGRESWTNESVIWHQLGCTQSCVSINVM